MSELPMLNLSREAAAEQHLASVRQIEVRNIAVKVITDLGDEVMKVFRVE